MQMAALPHPLSSSGRWAAGACGPPKEMKNTFCPATALHGSVTLPFVIPSSSDFLAACFESEMNRHSPRSRGPKACPELVEWGRPPKVRKNSLPGRAGRSNPEEDPSAVGAALCYPERSRMGICRENTQALQIRALRPTQDAASIFISFWVCTVLPHRGLLRC